MSLGVVCVCDCCLHVKVWYFSHCSLCLAELCPFLEKILFFLKEGLNGTNNIIMNVASPFFLLRLKTLSALYCFLASCQASLSALAVINFWLVLAGFIFIK